MGRLVQLDTALPLFQAPEQTPATATCVRGLREGWASLLPQMKNLVFPVGQLIPDL
jgi:hypothetical protein